MGLTERNTRRVPIGQQHVYTTNRSQWSPWTCVMPWTYISHWDTIFMRFASSLQQCNVVTSRFGNRQQRLTKRIMPVFGSRLCCTGTGTCCRKSEVADFWNGVLCWSMGTDRRSLRTFHVTQEPCQDVYALISFMNTTYPNK